MGVWRFACDYQAGPTVLRLEVEAAPAAMKVLIIKAMADGHYYSLMAKALCGALVELGCEAAVTDQSAHVKDQSADVGPLAAELSRTRPDVVVSISSFFGNAALESGVSLYDAVGAKFVGWQLDHPIYVWHGLSRATQGRHTVYSNHNHLKFAQAIGVSGKGLALLAGAERPASPAPDYRTRPTPVFVAATWNGVPERPWESLPPSPAKQLVMGMVERLLRHPEASLIDAFNETARALGLAVALGADRSLDDGLIPLFRMALTHVRHWDRLKLVEALVASGLPLTLCGSGWRGHFGDRPQVRYLDSVPFEAIAGLYRQAKVCINLNAGNGGCERAVNAMLAGSAVASDFSRDLATGFRRGEEIAFFDRADPAGIADVVGDLLESDRGEAMAQQGRLKAEQTALWRHRAESLLRLVG